MKLETENEQIVPKEVLTIEVSPFEKFVAIVDKIIYGINDVLHKISSIILFSLMFLTTFDVIGRYFFNKPIIGTYELTGLALALMIFFSLGMGQLKKEHIEIDFLTNKMPKKVQHGLYALSSLILFILTALMTWQLFAYSNRILLGNETSGDLGLPLYIFVLISAIGAISFTLTYLLDFFNSILKAVKKG